MNLKTYTILFGLALLITSCGTTLGSGASGNFGNARTFTFSNQCPFIVWIGGTGADAGPCDTSGNCPSGRACGAGNRCFWALPQPDTGSLELASNNGMATVTIPAAEYIHPNSGASIQWSGNVFGRTHCDANGENCLSADCNGNPCAVGVGGRPPVTLAEFTLQNTLVDVYDISVINGSNVPLAMTPNPQGSYAAAPTGMNEADYWCGNPGSATPTRQGGPSNLMGCNWNFAPPDVEYQFVTQGGANCNADGDCVAPDRCGLSIPEVAPGGSGQKTCGTALGFWTAVSICGLNPNFAGAFDCNMAVPAPNGNYNNLTHLYGCVLDEVGTPGAESCYTNGAASTCCGCENWAGIPSTQACQNQNTFWTQEVLPRIQFLKSACPMAYAYQYDDKTSTFNCQTGESPNQVNYLFTFCPGGKTGF